MRAVHARRWFGALAVALGLTVAAQTPARFKARLSTVPIDFLTAADVTGSGSAAAALTGNKLSVTGTFEGLRTPATIAQIHGGPRGIRGPALLDLEVTKATSGTIKASLQLTPAQVENLKQGRLYIQIHSEKAPDGNLWGWLLSEEG
jgi:hypothetical protein